MRLQRVHLAWIVWIAGTAAAALGAAFALRDDAEESGEDALDSDSGVGGKGEDRVAGAIVVEPKRDDAQNGLREPARDAAATCAFRPQPADGRLRIGTVTRSTARACRPYELRHDRFQAAAPQLPDLWWQLGSGGRTLDVALDHPFNARRVLLQLYGWYRGDRGLCGGTLDVAIDGGPTRPVAIAAACDGRSEHNFVHTAVVELDGATAIRRLHIVDRVEPGAHPGYVLLAGIELVEHASPEPMLPRVVDVWAAVHEPADGIPGMGLWLVAPDRAPRRLATPLTAELGAEVVVWSRPRSTRVFLGAPNQPALARELHTFDAATDAAPRRLATLDHPIVDAWYDDCLGALELALADGSRRFAFDDGRVVAAPCDSDSAPPVPPASPVAPAPPTASTP